MTKKTKKSPESPRRPRKPSKYEQVKYIAPAGTRAFYRSAAALAGVKLNDWIRETLHREASRLHSRRGVEYDPPPVHPEPPPPLLGSTR